MFKFIKKQKLETKPRETINLKGTKCNLYVLKELPDEIEMTETDYKRIWNSRPKEPDVIKMFGKDVKTPRLTKSFGLPYHFSGTDHPAEEIKDEYLKKLQEWVNKDSGRKFNQVLINWYRDGNDYIGRHSDDETEIEPDTEIYSFSFGGEREFEVVPRSETGDTYYHSIKMKNNSCIIMGPGMQKVAKHGVKKVSEKSLLFDKSRINITFRCFKKK